VRIVYRPREDTTPASELSTLAVDYRFALEQADRKASHVISTNSAPLRSKEEVRDVERQPN
jgi:hypothetical protein